MHAIRLQKIERRAKERIWNLQLWIENPRPRKNRAPGQNSDPLNSSLLGAVWNKNKSRPIPIEKTQEPNQATKQVVRNPSAYYRGEEKLAVVVNKNHQCDEHHCNCWKERNTNGVVKGSFVFYLVNGRFIHNAILHRCLSKSGGTFVCRKRSQSLTNWLDRPSVQIRPNPKAVPLSFRCKGLSLLTPLPEKSVRLKANIRTSELSLCDSVNCARGVINPALEV